MNGKYFIDTNIFVYWFDDRVKAKQQKARQIIEQAVNGAAGIISYQVIQEFLHVAAKKFSKTMSIYEGQYFLDTVLAPLCEVYPTIEFYKNTVVVQNEMKCSFYDALIVAAAVQEHCSILYSEDLQHGRVISGVKIQNPFI